MQFLKNKGFTDEEVNRICTKYEGTLDNFEFISDNVMDVIDYFESYGIKDIPELMFQRIDIFYLAVEKLKDIFSHYDKDYIIESLNKDPAIFDELD